MRGNKWLWLGAGVILFISFEIALRQLWPSIDDDDPPPGLELQLATVAVIVLAALPHVVAALGYRGRPWLLKVAGTICLSLSFLSLISPLLIVAAVPLFLIPGIVYLVTSRRQGRYEQRMSTAALAALCLVLGAGAAGAFMLTRDPRCHILVVRGGEPTYETPAHCDPNSTGRLGPEVVAWSGEDDTIAWHEALFSLALSGSVIALCVRSARRSTAPSVAAAAT